MTVKVRQEFSCKTRSTSGEPERPTLATTCVIEMVGRPCGSDVGIGWHGLGVV
jgi:hypothetical protein